MKKLKRRLMSLSPIGCYPLVSRLYPRPDRRVFDTAVVVIQLMGVLPKRNKEKEGPAIRPC
ncbi:MAG: hypothetical protein OXI63_20200 [Candidatus Poribacteria bacterium]|nr:hypothetical protein [Candidatus Poribacteria bacterium]